MQRHRTTARGVLLLALAVGLTAAAAGAARPQEATIIFPVVGQVSYEDDFGQSRPGGKHQGIDILAPRKAVAVAAETGKVSFWTTSPSAGCMLYLHGDSGTTYLYIHLNNDLGKRNDNKGKCVAGTAYAPGLKDGARVQAGQQVGFVGDSGDANGLHSHLHFEVHPNDGKAVDPYPYLQAALPLLFYAKPGTVFGLVLSGSVTSASTDQLQIEVKNLQVLPGGSKQAKLTKELTIAVPATAVVRDRAAPSPSQLLASSQGQPVSVWTQPALATLNAERGDPGTLTAAVVQLG
jgi:hypothetical protein